MRGNITRRGKHSWRIKFDLGTDMATGERRTEYVTVKGTKADANRELTKRLSQLDGGTYVARSSETVAEHVRAWLAGNLDIAETTRERFARLIEQQIVPHLGAVQMQQLRPAQISTWHKRLRASGGKNGRPLAAATVKQAHRVLHLALADALEVEKIGRNVASGRKLPKGTTKDIIILQEGEIAPVLAALAGHWLLPIAVLAVGTGMRQGELMGLAWRNMDFDAGIVRVERSLEETKAYGLRFKKPKTKAGIRTISLPASATAALQAHRKQQLEQRLALGLGKPSTDALVFCDHEAQPIAPSRVSGAWRDFIKAKKLPHVRFHDLRHTHASALISSGMDVVKISKRLGHASPVVTLTIYAHLFKQADGGAADAIEAAMRTGAER
ncbi:MAG: site-specific integrase [Rhizobiaceae bacterium]|nr:site-specific integrase [Rhizobiaceae bacterium]